MKALTELAAGFVSEDGGPVEDPVYSRRAGDRQFNETIRLVKQADESNSGGGPTLPGMGGGPSDEPTLPGMGGFDDDDGDDGPSLPFF